jgi:hypothetical protein
MQSEKEEPQRMFAMQAITKDTKQLADLRSRFATRAQATGAQPKPLIVIDAPNVAMRHGRQKKFSSLGVRLCAQYWQREGHKVIAFLPDYYLDYQKVAEKKR